MNQEQPQQPANDELGLTPQQAQALKIQQQMRQVGLSLLAGADMCFLVSQKSGMARVRAPRNGSTRGKVTFTIPGGIVDAIKEKRWTGFFFAIPGSIENDEKAVEAAGEATEPPVDTEEKAE